MSVSCVGWSCHQGPYSLSQFGKTEVPFFRWGKFGESGVFGQGRGKFGKFVMIVDKTSAVG